jgi:hypothetical protein
LTRSRNGPTRLSPHQLRVAAVLVTAVLSAVASAGLAANGQGKKLITDLVVGDRVLVQASVCKADLAEGAIPPLTAVRVVAHSAKA